MIIFLSDTYSNKPKSHSTSGNCRRKHRIDVNQYHLQLHSCVCCCCFYLALSLDFRPIDDTYTAAYYSMRLPPQAKGMLNLQAGHHHLTTLITVSVYPSFDKNRCRQGYAVSQSDRVILSSDIPVLDDPQKC